MSLSNLTIDDTSNDIVYSPNWATQSSLDPADGSFFQSTYHSAQADGASANLTFTGSAIYLFGSKGPGHANYSIQFDNDIIFYSATGSDTLYRQPLFGFVFNQTGDHFVSLTAHFVEGGQWLDLDYITIMVNDTTSVSAPSTSTSPSVSQTITPPWLLEGGTSSTSSPSTTTATSGSVASSGNTTTSSHLTLVLAVVFGALFVIAVVFGLGACLWRRRAASRSGDPSYRASHASFTSRPGGGGVVQGGGGGLEKIPLAAQLSPRIIGHEAYLPAPPSPAGQSDKEFATAVENAYNNAYAAPQLHDGRHSPFSMLSQGSMAALLKKTGEPRQPRRKPQPWKAAAAQSQPHPEPPAQQQPQHFAPPRRSMSLSRPSAFLPTRRAPTPDTIASVASHYSQAQSQRSHAPTATGTAAGATSSPQDSPMTFTKALDTERLAPLAPLRANHAQSMFSLDSLDEAVEAPRRPRRPGEGLLDWLGNARFLDRDPSEAKQRRRDDGNSSRTDFLKV